MSTVTLRWIGDLDQDKREQAGCVSSSSDQYRPKKIELKPGQKEIRIGRINTKMPPDYPIESCINSRMISRNHATIERSAKGGSMLYDHSMNGTYVNYTRVTGGVTLKHGDIVCFGHLNGANLKPGEKVSLFYSDLKYLDLIESALTLKLRLDCLDDVGPTRPTTFSGQTPFKLPPLQNMRPIICSAPLPSSLFYQSWYRLQSAVQSSSETESPDDEARSGKTQCFDPIYRPPLPHDQSISEAIKFSVRHCGRLFRVIVEKTNTSQDLFTVSTDPWVSMTTTRFDISALEDPNRWIREYLFPAIEQEQEIIESSNSPPPASPTPTTSST